MSLRARRPGRYRETDYSRHIWLLRIVIIAAVLALVAAIELGAG